MNGCFSSRLIAVVISACLTSTLRADETSPVRIERDLAFAGVDGRKLKLGLVLPSTAEQEPLVVWIHGGGWRGGSKNNLAIQYNMKHGLALASISNRLED